MKKKLFAILAVLVLSSMILAACGTPAPATEAPAVEEPAVAGCTPKDVKKIAFFVSDLSNVFHQGQATEAQRYAKEKYGVDVTIFDGKADGAVMAQNVDQIMAQGMDAATLHIWDYEFSETRCARGT